MKIKELDKHDLPREKFEKYGPSKLQDYELLAILLGSGIKGLNVLELSKKILKVISRIGIGNITLDELVKIKGLGHAKAISILASIHLVDRITNHRHREIVNPESVWLLCNDIKNSKKEHFVAFYIDAQNTLIERRIISVGILDASIVHPREVFEPALQLSAASIIVAHNHPSGSLEPSDADIEVTRRLVEAGKLLGVEVVDHVIVTKERFASIRNKL